MMTKRLLLILAAAAVLLFVPSSAEAQTCFGGACDWVDESFYDASAWDLYGASVYQIADPCLWGAPQNHIAELPGSASIVRDPFYVDGTYLYGTSFSLEFNLYLIDDTENWYDRLKIVVHDQTANTTEIFFISGDEYDTSCSRVSIPLSNNYRNHTVSISFEMSWLASGSYQIDNVSFYQY